MTDKAKHKERSAIWKHVDLKVFEETCLANEDHFLQFGKAVGKGEERYIYIDRGSSILGVAHMDSVQGIKFFQLMQHPMQWRIYSPTLDDRAGVYTILHLLPQIGVNCDVLLTTGEEKGKSTAKLFQPPEGKKYKWIFSFDRMEDTTVLYGYDNSEMRELLRKYDFRHAQGMWSCIGELERLGVKGFNFGVGYKNYHDEWAYLVVAMWLDQVAKFKRFYHDLQGKTLEHKKILVNEHRANHMLDFRGQYPRDPKARGPLPQSIFEYAPNLRSIL